MQHKDGRTSTLNCVIIFLVFWPWPRQPWLWPSRTLINWWPWHLVLTLTFTLYKTLIGDLDLESIYQVLTLTGDLHLVQSLTIWCWSWQWPWPCTKTLPDFDLDSDVDLVESFTTCCWPWLVTLTLYQDSTWCWPWPFAETHHLMAHWASPRPLT